MNSSLTNILLPNTNNLFSVMSGKISMIFKVIDSMDNISMMFCKVHEFLRNHLLYFISKMI